MDDQRDDIKAEIDSLAELYQKDPEAFEAVRRSLIERTIENFPEEYRSRARGIQFQLDTTLSRYKDPVARMNKMVEIFWEQFKRFQEAVCTPDLVAQRREERPAAKVIPLRRH